MQYSDLVRTYEALAATTKRLEKTHLIAELLSRTDQQDLEPIILLLQGRVFSQWDKQTLGVSSKLAVKAIIQASGEPEKKVMTHWRKTGDLGLVAKELIGKKKQSTLFQQDLTVKQVFDALRKLPSIEGTGSVGAKLGAIAGLFAGASPEEAQYLIRTVLEELRLGVADGTLRDAICWAYLGPPILYDLEKQDLILADDTSRQKYNELCEAVQAAYDRCNDFARVALVAKEKGVAGLKSITFTLGTPIRVMLAQREATVASALERCSTPGFPACAVEYKYDGFRMQVHKDGEQVRLFTRRLEEVTAQFPDVIAHVKAHVTVKQCLVDCEAVGFDRTTGKYTAFQKISQRIRRKYDIEQVAGKFPVELVMFDILYRDGEELLAHPFKERRAILEKVLTTNVPQKIRLSAFLETADEHAAEKFYQESLAAGNEGVMVKNLAGVYKPGARVGHMVKVKPTLDTMDLVIIGAEWGEGKRSGWLTSFELACYDPVEDEFLAIGRVGTGLKELDSEDPLAVTFDKLTNVLKEDIVEEEGRSVVVKPRIIIEIKFEEVQQSPSYGSGYALRFPRVVQLREDRGVEDMTSLDEVRIAYKLQRGRG